MSVSVKRRHDLFSRKHEQLSGSEVESVTPNRKRDAREMAATMDHSDIRGLVTAFHLFLAGLPCSNDWNHLKDVRIKTSRVPLIGPARRVAVSVYELLGECARVSGLRRQADTNLGSSGGDFDLSGNILEEASQLSSNSDTAFVLSHFPPCIQLAKSIGQTQLGLPGDIADGFGLTLLAHFDGTAHPGVEAVSPGGFHRQTLPIAVGRRLASK